MADEYGALATGFRRKRLDTIYDELCQYFKGTLGVDPSENPQSIFAVLVLSFADQIEKLWEQLEAVYYQSFPGSASGVNLDNVLQVAGFTRKERRRSRYVLACTGDDGTTIPYGSVVKSTTQPERQLQSSVNQQISRENFWQIKVRPVLTDISTSTSYTITLHQNIDSGAVGTVVQTYTKTITGCATYAAAYAAMKAAFVEAAEKIGFSVSEEATGEMDDQGQEVKLVVATGLKADDSFFADLTPNVQVEQVTSTSVTRRWSMATSPCLLGTITKVTRA